MRTSIDIFLIIILFFIIVFTQINLPAFAVYNTTDIDVNVSELLQITLSPTSLSWTGVITGTVGVYKNITLTNTGSVNVSDIYAYVDTLVDESERPYGTGNAQKYAAGGVLTLENETEAKYYYLGKIEWNWTEDIPSHDWTSGPGVNNPVAWGFFKNLTITYVWVVGNGTSGLCNNSGAQFAISDIADNGTVATRTPLSASITRNSGDANYAYFSVARSSASLYTYCVAVSTDCKKIYIYNFDKRAGFTNCLQSDYLYNGNLVSGSPVTLHVNPWVPWGTPAGDLNTSTLTIVASP